MQNSVESVDRYFQAVSYMVAVCCFAALFSSGAIGTLVTVIAIIAVIVAWNIEGSERQLSERNGLVIIAMMIIVFILELRFSIFGLKTVNSIPIGSLGWLILFLCLIKLLQKKTDRDWIFIYIISFFEILLAAGLSISPLFLVYFVGFLVFSTCAILTLDIRRTIAEIRLGSESKDDLANPRRVGYQGSPIAPRTFSLIGVGLIIVTGILALPLFYVFPRDSIGGFGNPLAGVNSISGFSDSVRLGEIGTLKQSDEMVMRVKVEGEALPQSGLYWRGVTLDQFDNRRWRRAKLGDDVKTIRSSNNVYGVNPGARIEKRIMQRFYLEPIGNSTLFAISTPFLLQGNLQAIRKSIDNSMRSDKVGFERAAYTVVSDPSIPSAETLKEDNGSYGEESRRYLQVPNDLDPRVSKLASDIVNSSGAGNNFDRAKVFERYLRTEYGYSLEMSSTGDQPLSDFLFNVRKGHCEYFASAMVIMLRTQGIASRMVNGFQQGDYNESADMYVVRQRNAHSWVEVYFPETKSWITFDPTPSAGRYNEPSTASFWDRFGNYKEALEMIWIRYFVSYDSQEQSSLISSIKTRVSQDSEGFTATIDAWRKDFIDWWEEVRGDQGLQASLIAIGYGAAYLIAGILGVVLLIWIAKKIIGLSIWKALARWIGRTDETVRIIEFYQRMQRVLMVKGITREPHQTPLEFAYALNIPEAVKITEKYNGVRFGEKDLSKNETEEIENWLKNLEED